MNERTISLSLLTARLSVLILALSLALLCTPDGQAAQRLSSPQPPAGTITGVVWHDLDVDLFPDANEPRLADVTITLRDAAQAYLTRTVSGADGIYRFDGLSAGVYWVVETDPPGFISTTDNNVRVQLIGSQGAEVNFGDVLPFTDTPTPAVTPLVMTFTINAGPDDTAVRSDLGVNQVTSPALRLGRDGAYSFVGGFRFGSVNLPVGAQVTEARLRLQPSGAHGGGLPVQWVVHGEASDAAPDFQPSNPLAPLRPRTQAAADWLVDSWPTDAVESPNLAGPLQEIIDRPGWSAGSAMAFLVFSLSSNTGYLDVHAWDGNPTLAARLEITFRPPPGWSTPTPTATGTGTPTPTLTATVTATATDAPTATPTTIVTMTPTPTTIVTMTPTPTTTLTMTPTPTTTLTKTPTPTARPTLRWYLPFVRR